MDFIDRVITSNLRGNLPDEVRPRPRARFETPDGIAGLEKHERAVRAKDQSMDTYPVSEIPRDDDFQQRDATLFEHKKVLTQEAESENVFAPKKSPKERLLPKDEGASYIEKNKPRATNNQPLILHSSRSTEDSSRQFLNIGSFEKSGEREGLEQSDQMHNTVERLTIVERSKGFIRPQLPPITDQQPKPQRVEKGLNVNIAIGRIEVHTPPPHVAVQKQTVATRKPVSSLKPVRSLEAYLSRRNE